MIIMDTNICCGLYGYFPLLYYFFAISYFMTLSLTFLLSMLLTFGCCIGILIIKNWTESNRIVLNYGAELTQTLTSPDFSLSVVLYLCKLNWIKLYWHYSRKKINFLFSFTLTNTPHMICSLLVCVFVRNLLLDLFFVVPVLCL